MISRTARGRSRTRRGAALVAALLLVPSPAFAQESEPETGDIGNGTARAAALIARAGPSVGNLQLTIRAGLAITQLTNSVAQATGQTLDLGLIGTALTAEGCDGALISASQLPQSTNIDNRAGAAHLQESETQTHDTPVSIGNKVVSAGVDPTSSEATTTATLIDIPGVLQIGVGRATAVTEVLPGEGRQATATVSMTIKVGGIELSGLEWRAFHRTGANPRAEGSFQLANVAGIPLLDVDLSQLQVLESLINTIGVAVGLSIEFPRVERFLEPTDVIRVTPLRISLRDTPLGAVIAPIKTAAQPSLDQAFKAVTDVVCQAGAVPLVADVLTSVVSGSGSLTLEVGGVEASSSPFVSNNPFGEIPPMVEPPTVTTSGPTTPTPTPAMTSPAATQTVAPPSSSEEVASPPTIASSSQGPLERFCASVHPNGNSCSEGAALALGLLGVLVTIALAGFEIRKQWPRGDGS